MLEGDGKIFQLQTGECEVCVGIGGIMTKPGQRWGCVATERKRFTSVREQYLSNTMKQYREERRLEKKLGWQSAQQSCPSGRTFVDILCRQGHFITIVLAVYLALIQHDSTCS